MGQYKVHLTISILIVLFILIMIPLIFNVELFSNEIVLGNRFGNNFKNSEAYVICMSDSIYEECKKKIKNKVAPYELKKFNAVKGSELGKTVNNKEILTIGALYDITVPDTRRTHAELGSRNAIGCYLSHTALWTKLIDSKCDGFFIFESDAVCNENVVSTLAEFTKTVKDFDILFFGNFGINIFDQSKIKKITGRFYGTHAYYITLKGAIKCLKYAFPIEQQIDSYLSDLVLINEKRKKNNLDTIDIDEVNFYTSNTCKQHNPTGTTIQTKIVLCNI